MVGPSHQFKKILHHNFDVWPFDTKRKLRNWLQNIDEFFAL